MQHSPLQNDGSHLSSSSLYHFSSLSPMILLSEAHPPAMHTITPACSSFSTSTPALFAVVCPPQDPSPSPHGSLSICHFQAHHQMSLHSGCWDTSCHPLLVSVLPNYSSGGAEQLLCVGTKVCPAAGCLLPSFPVLSFHLASPFRETKQGNKTFLGSRKLFFPSSTIKQ